MLTLTTMLAFYAVLPVPERIIQSPCPTSEIVDRCMLLILNPHVHAKNKVLCAELDGYAEIMMPTYNKLLMSPETNRAIVNGILGEVIRQKRIDRSLFIPTCHELLKSQYAFGALRLLAEIASDHDTAPIHVLLLDHSDAIRIQASETIGKVGGKKDVVALDLWLRSGNWHDDKHHKERVQKMRDELVAKLKKEDDYRNSKPDPSVLKAKPSR